MPTALQDGQTFLFIGDSITDCGRREDRGRPLGLGYVRMFHDMLIAREPEKNVTVINKGIGGNTIEDLQSRWCDDVLPWRPDWLSVKIGINDSNRHLCSPDESYLPPGQFREIYIQLLERTVRDLPDIRLLLIDPFYIGHPDDMDGSYRRRLGEKLPQYIAVVQEMSERFNARHVKTNEIFQRHLTFRQMDEFAPEPVHPHATGHLIIAEAVYVALCW